MPDADQAGHGLYVPSVPTGAAALQTQPQCLRLAFHLAAADGSPHLQPLGIVQTLRVLREVADQTLRRLAAAFPLLVLDDSKQFTYPGADPSPPLASQQPAALF